ncbi:hypothetical protein IMY05_001G0143900 [Salix suchowensis]|nr:hypothetical protein IMY05_001G0143900 [Salix suchowensis]
MHFTFFFFFCHLSIIHGGILILIFRANQASSVLVSMQGTGGGDLISGKEAVFCVESGPKHVISCGNLELISTSSLW